MKVKFLNLCPPEDLRTEIDYAYTRVMDSGMYVGGVEPLRFAAEFKNYIYQNTYFKSGCVAVGNGFDGLQLALRALDAGSARQEEVIVPAFTARPVWASVYIVGATPVPVQPDPETYNVTRKGVLNAVTESTVAVILVHMFGRPIDDIEEISAELRRMNIPIIEDCSQAHGASSNNRKVGIFGDYSVFSFYPTKNIGAFGDAGAICMRNIVNLSRIAIMKEYGNDVYNGINSRMDAMQAAFLRVKLRHLDNENKQRKANANVYLGGLKDIEWLQLPKPHKGHVWHQFVVRCEHRDVLADYLEEHEIETMVHYRELPEPTLARMIGGDYTDTEAAKLSRTVLSLPIASHVTEEQLEYVVERIREYEPVNC